MCPPPHTSTEGYFFKICAANVLVDKKKYFPRPLNHFEKGFTKFWKVELYRGTLKKGTSEGNNLCYETEQSNLTKKIIDSN